MLYTRTTILVVTALAMLLCTSNGVAKNFRDNPGYIDLEWIEIPSSADEVRDIDLSTMLVSVAADAQDKGYGEIAEALAMIKSIRVKSFSLTADDSKKIEKSVANIAAQLKDDDWNRLIYVKDKEESVTVSTKNGKDGTMVGLMLVVYEPENEVTFANIVGNLDIATLFHLVGLMDSDEFEDIMVDLELE